MRVFKSPSASPTCFFCLSPLRKQPRNPRSFKCPECCCWNRYDETGQILSDEPAMHDESMNVRSFAKRASPSKNRLPSTYKKNPFCHTCLTNQTLLTNLLSNYLPDSDDPNYETRVTDMPSYTAALQVRYPPVCKDCQQNVDDELRGKDHMARTAALGGWLKRSQHVGAKRYEEQQRAKPLVTYWKLRGVLWAGTIFLFLGVDITKEILNYNIERQWVAIFLPLAAFLSLFWSFWDPTWVSALHLRLHGRSFTVTGRRRFIACQTIMWFSRLLSAILVAFSYGSYHYLPTFMTPYFIRCWFTTDLATHLVLMAFSVGSIRVRQAQKVRLIESRSISRDFSRDSTPTCPSATSPPDPLFAGFPLGTSSQPPTMPVFGKPSFPSAIPTSETPDEDMMDWSPDHVPVKSEQTTANLWLKPQRFFPPNKPTGLEDLFTQAAKLDSDDESRKPTKKRESKVRTKTRKSAAKIREVGVFFGATVTVALLAGIIIRQF